MEEKLDRLTGVVESLAASVVHRDNRIAALLRAVERQVEQMETLEKRWES